MFKHFQNIETAVSHLRIFTIVIIVSTIAINIYALFKSHQSIQASRNKVYVIAGDKFMEAISTDRAESLPIEIKDHIRSFHQYFYGLEPDEQVNQRNINKALYLADASANRQYVNLKENGYYSSILSANISQRVEEPDSIQINLAAEPYQFRYFGKLKIIRSTSKVTRSLITEGCIRLTKPSDHNPHGMLIEKWNILSNEDLNIETK